MTENILDVYNGLKFFKAKEFPHPEKMQPELLKKLDIARQEAGIPFVITSSYREGDPLSHGKGLAVDIRAHGSKERRIIAKALDRVGFRRLGIYDRHIHADLDDTLPEGWWGGKSE